MSEQKKISKKPIKLLIKEREMEAYLEINEEKITFVPDWENLGGDYCLTLDSLERVKMEAPITARLFLRKHRIEEVMVPKEKVEPDLTLNLKEDCELCVVRQACEKAYDYQFSVPKERILVREEVEADVYVIEEHDGFFFDLVWYNQDVTISSKPFHYRRKVYRGRKMVKVETEALDKFLIIDAHTYKQGYFKSIRDPEIVMAPIVKKRKGVIIPQSLYDMGVTTTGASGQHYVKLTDSRYCYNQKYKISRHTNEIEFKSLGRSYQLPSSYIDYQMVLDPIPYVVRQKRDVQAEFQYILYPGQVQVGYRRQLYDRLLAKGTFAQMANIEDDLLLKVYLISDRDIEELNMPGSEVIGGGWEIVRVLSHPEIEYDPRKLIGVYAKCNDHDSCKAFFCEGSYVGCIREDILTLIKRAYGDNQEVMSRYIRYTMSVNVVKCVLHGSEDCGVILDTGQGIRISVCSKENDMSSDNMIKMLFKQYKLVYDSRKRTRILKLRK